MKNSIFENFISKIQNTEKLAFYRFKSEFRSSKPIFSFFWMTLTIFTSDKYFRAPSQFFIFRNFFKVSQGLFLELTHHYLTFIKRCRKWITKNDIVGDLGRNIDLQCMLWHLWTSTNASLPAHILFKMLDWNKQVRKSEFENLNVAIFF